MKSYTQEIITVERAVGELRRGYPVEIHHQEVKIVVAAVETIDQTLLEAMHKPKLLLSAKRVEWLAGHKNTQAAPILCTIDADTEKGLELCYILAGLGDTETESESLAKISLPKDCEVPRYPDALIKALFELVHVSELVPALIVSEATALDTYFPDILCIHTDAIMQYRDAVTKQLEAVCTAPLALKGAEQASITAFRPTVGGCEHYAITIGTPNKEAPLVRVHSSCYTGDLLASLCCDCGDQLHGAIHAMAESEDGGGIILYLMQEGRGIGLTNKLRTYILQKQGLDTVDANNALGFEDDTRLFQPAVTMLECMGISHIKLLTNNPRKAKGLSELGVNVVECVPHVIEAGEHNKHYLASKQERLGHIFKDKAG